MQKNYREFTVGELLDLGLNVGVSTHNIQSVEEGRQITAMFEGTKQSTQKINDNLTIVRGWKGNFEVVCYL